MPITFDQMPVMATRSGRQSSTQHEQPGRAKWKMSLTKVLADLLVDQSCCQGSQTPSQSYCFRLHGLLHPVWTENARSGNESENTLEVAENGGLLLNLSLARVNPSPTEHDVAPLSSATH